MKLKSKIQKAVLAVAAGLFVFGYNALAGVGEAVKMESLDGKKQVKISVMDPVKLKKVSVSNLESDYKYYSKRVKSDKQYTQVFDMSKLRKGVYEFAFDFGNEKVTKIVKLDGESVNLVEETKLKEPFVAQKEKYVHFSFLNQLETPVRLEIKSNGSSFFSKSLGSEFNMSRRLDLSSLTKGSYEMVVANGKQTYKYDLEVK
jgi:hypothetical protein